MSIADFCQWLQDTPVGEAIRMNGWLFPTIESIHVLALVLVVGSVAMVDLRLLGVSGRNHAVTQLSNDTLPYTWAAFVVAAITGVLLFTSQASKYYINFPFRMKMLFMFCAAVNMLIFEFFVYKSVKNWDTEKPTPTGAKVAGTLSLAFWICVIFFGRWIGFTIGA